MTKTKFTINRRRWYRGKPNARLWNSEKRAGCCLGHVCKQLLECTWKELNHVSLPWHLADKHKLPDDFRQSKILIGDNIFGNESLASRAVPINDDTTITDEVREQRLIALFKENGYELEFYN